MEKLSDLINDESKHTEDVNRISNELTSIAFAIYCFNGKSICIDSDSKHCKTLSSLYIDSDNQDQRNNTNHHTITDINAESKGKSICEIKQLILKKLDLYDIDHSQLLFMQCDTNKLTFTKKMITNNKINHSIELSQRRKGEKLSKDQILFIKDLIDSKRCTLKEISCNYSISLSSLRNIQKMSTDIINRPSLRSFEKLYLSQRSNIIEIIKQYYEEMLTEFTSSDIQKHLLDKYQIVCSLRQIRNIMKNDLNLTYKKCASRPNNVDLNRVKALRFMFCVEFSKALKSETLILNIDECVISRTTKNNYSWSLKGQNKEINNSPFTGSLSIILAILSNGLWFLLATDSTINSTIFSHFIKKLEFWVFSKKNFGYENALIIMDNCPSHKSNLTLSTLKKTKFKVSFLPTYSPDLAPVEMCFSHLKRKLCSISRGKIVYLKKKFEQNIILKAMKTISRELIKKWYLNLYDTVKLYLNSF